MRPHHGVLFMCALGVLSVGCATPLSKPESNVDHRKRAALLARELRKKNALIEELREKNHVLSLRKPKIVVHEIESPAIAKVEDEVEQELSAERSEVWKIPSDAFGKTLEQQTEDGEFGPVSHMGPLGPESNSAPITSETSPLASPEVGAELPLHVLPKTLPQKKSKGAARTTNAAGWVRGPKPAPPVPAQVVKPRQGTETGEAMLYGKVMQSYKRRDVEQLKSATALFLKTYPQSVYADNALYLEALVAISSQQWEAARTLLERLLKSYPHGNKAVSALFASAVVARHLHDFSAARSYLRQVTRDYPGSSESDRAELEQRIISQLETTRRSQ